MPQLLIALVVVVLAAAVALAVRSRRRTEAPTQPTFEVPSQLDRADFEGAQLPWLLVVFTSSTCDACAQVSAAAFRLADPATAVQLVPYQRQRALHDRYRIEAVPTLLLADGDGVVRHHVLGPVAEADLAAAVDALRRG